MIAYQYGIQDGLKGAHNNLYDKGTSEYREYERGYSVGLAAFPYIFEAA